MNFMKIQQLISALMSIVISFFIVAIVVALVGCSSVDKNVNKSEIINTNTDKTVYYYDDKGKVSKIEIIKIEKKADKKEVSKIEKKNELSSISKQFKYIIFSIFGIVFLIVGYKVFKKLS